MLNPSIGFIVCDCCVLRPAEDLSSLVCKWARVGLLVVHGFSHVFDLVDGMLHDFVSFVIDHRPRKREHRNVRWVWKL